MKNSVIIMLSALLCMISCTKSAENNQEDANRKKINVSVNGLIGDLSDDGTKAEAQQVIRIVWTGGEKVFAYCGEEYLGELEATPLEKDNRVAYLNGTIKAPKSGNTITLVYSTLSDSAPEVKDGALNFDISTQDQDAVPFVIYGTLDYDNTTELKNVIVPFSFATSIIKVNCTGLVLGNDVQSASINEVNTICKLTLSETEAPSVSGDVKGEVVRTTGFQCQDERAIFSIATTSSAKSEDRKLVLRVNYIPFTTYFTSNALDVSKSYNALYKLYCDVPEGAIPSVFSTGENTKVYFSHGNLYYDIPNNEWDFYENQMDYDPEYRDDRIFLFTWGLGDWSTIPDTELYAGHAQFRDWGEAYCESHDIKDKKTWRTLSHPEWNYLINTRELNGGSGLGYTYTFYDGTGMIIFPDNYTGETGLLKYIPEGCIFLPLAGERHADGVWLSGTVGEYWDSTEWDSFPDTGSRNLTFERDETSSQMWITLSDLTDRHDRGLGLSVRLVSDWK